jgi:hypothetical protein
MRKLLFLLLAALPALLSAQDKIINDPDAQSRTIGSFHAIRVSTGIELVMRQGAVDAVAVSASDRESRDRVKTEVVDGVLKIYYDNKNWWGNSFKNRHLKAYVSFKNIDKFNGSSGSSTTVDGSITAGGLKVVLSSGAHFKGDIKSTGLHVDQSSGSHATVSGEAQTLTVATSSGAHFFGYGIACGKCNADASSGSKIEVTVNRELEAEASSGGGIHYKGTGVITRISTGSGGSVKKNS